MAGMIDQEMQDVPVEQAPADPAAPAAPAQVQQVAPTGVGAQAAQAVVPDQQSEELLSPVGMMKNMKLPPTLNAQLSRVVAAGMKVMFSPQTHHKLMLKELDKPGPLPPKLGMGVAGLMGMLFQQSKRSVPMQLLVPAGMVLIAHAADFIAKSSEPVTNPDIAGAIEIMTDALLKAFHVDPEKVLAMIGAGGPPAAAPQAGQEPPLPEPAAPAPAPQEEMSDV